jgi:hypothetical protein
LLAPAGDKRKIRFLVMRLSLKAKKKAYIEAQGHPFERKVTHTEYTDKGENLGKGKWSRVLNKRITDDKEELEKDAEGVLLYADDNYMQLVVPQKIMPLAGLGTFLFLLLMHLFIMFGTKGENSIGVLLLLLLLFLSGFSFFTYYYITMPYKECVFNRKEGLITIPGAFWQSNVTMHINTIEFTRSAPSAQGIGSHQLEVIRPMKGAFLSFYQLSLGNTCYEDLSFYLWYMDKNRPLPPGTAFDEFREQDFERRKTEGFPEPLFRCYFQTPEQTPEQQTTRREIGGW